MTVVVEAVGGALEALVAAATDVAAATFSSGKLAGDDLADRDRRRRDGLLSSVSLLALSVSTEVNSEL